MTIPDYLTEAAEMLALARSSNEARAVRASSMHSGQEREREKVFDEVNARRLEIADGLTRLAAISAGLPPCCCHRAQPDPGQETS